MCIILCGIGRPTAAYYFFEVYFGIFFGGNMDIFGFIRNAIHEIAGTPVEKIKPESTPRELNLDLFDIQELVIDAENEFDVCLPEETEIETIGDLARMIDAA